MTPLTRREHDVLHGISLGETAAETAVRLGITVLTVKWHRKHLYLKLLVHNSAGAVNAGYQNRLLP